MKFLMLGLALSSAAVLAQSSQNTTADVNKIEASVDSIPATAKVDPWNLKYNMTFHTNIDNAQDLIEDESVEGENLLKDVFMNTISLDKKFSLVDYNGLNISYSPEVSASFFDIQEDQGKSSDALKRASISNTLSFSTTRGNLEYGTDLNIGYDYGYTYRYRNGFRDGVLRAYRRNDNNLNGGITFNGNVNINDNWKIVTSLGGKFEDHVARRIPQTPDFVKYGAPGSGIYNFGLAYLNATNDRVKINANIENQFIVNENFNISIPLSITRTDHEDFAAFADGWNGIPVVGKTRLIDHKTAGIKLEGKLENLTLSTSYTFGDNDDKRADGEDAKTQLIETNLKLQFTDDVAFSATHTYDSWKYSSPLYDDVANTGGSINALDERYNTYGASLSVDNIANLPLSGTLSHKLVRAQGNYSFVDYTNNQTSLELSYKL